MEQFRNDVLEYAVDDAQYDDVSTHMLDDSDFEDQFIDMSKSGTDTSALEAKNGKDIQGIPWERLNLTRDKCRQSRLKNYKNYENLMQSRQKIHKEYKQVVKGNEFYDFQFNTRLVKSTVVHFQKIIFWDGAILNIVTKPSNLRPSFDNGGVVLRNLLWATSKHDVYLMKNYSVLHWNSLLRKSQEVLNVAKPTTPAQKHTGCQTLSRVQISTMTVKDNLMVAGGFQGELICKYLNQPEVAFCSKVATGENAITNAVDIYHNSSGSTRVIAANNDAQVKIFDTEDFACLSRFTFPWSVNNTSASADGKLLAVLGDSEECLIADAQSGKVLNTLKGHLDYSFASAWHPNGQVLATGNQDTTCRLWDIRNLSKSFAVLQGRMGAIRAIRFTSDGRFMAMAEPADFVHVFDTLSNYGNAQEIDLFGEIAGITFSPDSEALFVGVSDRTYGSLLEFNRRRNDDYLECMF